MKDPLQSEATPYEILGVAPGATQAELMAGFSAAIQRGVEAGSAHRARQLLQRTTDRLAIDLLLYDDETLARLSPSPLVDVGVLEPARRRSTGDAWEEQLRVAFPDVEIVHALGVLWYWSAVAEDERAEETPAVGSPEPPAIEHWRRAIGCWATLVNTDVFWQRRSTPPLPPSDREAWVRELIRHRTDAVATRLRSSGRPRLAERYSGLEIALTTELQAAAAMSQTGLATDRGPLACGPLMLGRVGLLDAARGAVEEALDADPSGALFVALRTALSPFADVEQLIAEGRPQQALDAMERLPPEIAASAEVAELRSRASAVLGSQAAEVGRLDDALGHWSRALEFAAGVRQSEAIRATVVETLRTAAAGVAHTDLDRAIAMLDRALALTDDEGVASSLAGFLYQRGRRTTQDALEAARGGDGGQSRATALRRDFDRGLADLERAADLGSAAAAAELETRREMRPQFEIATLLERAGRAAEAADWDKAVSNLREAVVALGDQAPDELRRNLAVALANRGVARGQAAMSYIDSHASSGTPDLPEAFRRLMTEVSLERSARDAKLGSRRRPWSPRRLIVPALLLLAVVIPWSLFFVLGIPDEYDDALTWVTWPEDATLQHAARAGVAVVYTALTYVWVPLVLIPAIVAFGSWLGSLWRDATRFPSYATGSSSYGEPVTRCVACSAPATHSIQLYPGRVGASGDGVPLCGRHLSSLEQAAEGTLLPDMFKQPASRKVDEATADLREAQSISPDLEGITDSLLQVEGLRTRFGLPVTPTIGRVPSDRSRPPATAGPSAAASPRADRRPGVANRPTTVVNVNTAGEDVLATVPGIGPALARRIVAYRQLRGPFQLLDHLKRVEGFGDAKYAEVRPYVTTATKR